MRYTICSPLRRAPAIITMLICWGFLFTKFTAILYSFAYMMG